MNIYDRIMVKLNENADGEYKAFNERIVNSEKPLIGVRTPIVKNIAKDIVKEDVYGFMNECRFGYYEDTLIYGLCVAALPYDEFIVYKDVFLKNADCWAHIDTFVPAIKSLKNEAKREEFFRYLKGEIFAAEGFFLRFYIVSLMRYYLDDGHIDFVFDACGRLCGKGYYNDMAIAWLLSVAYIDYASEVEELLASGKIEATVVKKTISKIRDSYRVAKEDKDRLKAKLWKF